MNLKLRPAETKDYQRFLELCEFVDQIHRDRLPTTFREPDGPSRGNEYFMRLINDPKHLLLMAENGERSVGLLSGRFQNAPDTPIHVPKQTFMIENIVVDPVFRRDGIGKMLHDHAIRHVKSLGVVEVNLILYAFNEAALKFYKKLGYKVECHWMSLLV